MIMRPFSGVVLALVLLLGGCATESADERAVEPPPGGTPTDAPAGDDVIALVSEPDVGGEVSPEAAPLDSPSAVADFTSQFEHARMDTAMAAALAGTTVPDGRTVMGAVVAIGCEPPTDVEIETGPEGVLVTAPPVKSDQQCLVPVTTVALVTVAQP